MGYLWASADKKHFSPGPSLLIINSIWSPYRFFQPCCGAHVGRGVAVTTFCLHHIALVWKIGVEESRPCGSISARREDTWG